MRSTVFILALALLVALFAPAAAAQQGGPTAGVVGRGGAPDLALPEGFAPVAASTSTDGLWLVDAGGEVVALDGARHHGDASALELRAQIVGMASTPTGGGYWLAAADGGVFTFGDAAFFGSMGGVALDRPIVDIAASHTGDGYWLVASDGGVFTFGDSRFLGSMGGIPLNRPVVGIAPTPKGDGYRLVASDGGVFAFGSAPFLGSTGAAPNASPVIGLAVNPDGDGYWLARANGSIVGFGVDTASGAAPTERTVAVVARPDGGLWLVGSPIPELPGGGTEVFADNRMVVAHYGSPGAPVLGILGELPPDAALTAVIQRASLYGTVGDTVVPAIEIIVTVAQRAPGPDGDYSGHVDRAGVEALVDAAERAGALVVLDLQPGRSTFLSQAVQYEDLLRRPHVGLALDPEWRMGPGQVPARVIGSVTAAEVNEVSAWLADLVADEGLPEKLFVIHQFTDAMVRDRAAILDRPGLAVTFHADGFGGRGAKIGDLVRYAGEPPFHTGFKLFIDEDTNLFSPAEVLALVPRPDLVTYQ